jgi:hypothetical protein
MIKDQIYELVIEDDNIDEVFAVSFVEQPAIESNFVYFNKQGVQFAAISDEKRLVMGPILVPDKKILRVDEMGQPYYVFFKPDTIKKLSEMYLQKKYNSETTLEHDKKIDNISLVESWITESRTKDKSALYGLSLPIGSWVGTFKVNNDDIWNNYVKTGDVKGFSIEGMFSHKLVEASMLEDVMEKEITELTDVEAQLVLSRMKALIKKDSRYKSGKRVDMESFSDYPDGVKNNAKKAIEWANKNGWGSCGTPVGKQRANQLAKGEPISADTIQRMYSFLSRHEGDLQSSKSFGDGCGYLMYMAWGGKAALGWAHNKLKGLGLIEAEGEPSIASTYPGEGPTKKKKTKMWSEVFASIK